MIANQLKKDDFYLPIIRLLDGLGGPASIRYACRNFVLDGVDNFNAG